MAAVLAAAEFLFVTQGYAGTTTEKIGELARLTKGSVYFYYGSKEGVLLELLNRVQADVLKPYVRLLQDSGLSPVERMTRFLELTGKVALEHPGSMLLPIVVSIELAGIESEAARRVKAGYNRIAKEIRNVLELGQASGAFRSDLNSSDMARLLISICDGMMLECLRQNRASGRRCVASAGRIVGSVLDALIVVASFSTISQWWVSDRATRSSFAEGEIGGDDDRGAFVEPADEVEDSMPSRGSRRVWQEN